jgi:preprotein translocase subunit SecG
MEGMAGWMKWAVALLAGFAIIALGFKFAGWLLTAFFVLNCLVLIIVVLLQSGKAADLAGAFGGMGSQTAFGPRGSATLLSKATTLAAALFMVTSLSLAILATRGAASTGSVLERVKAPANKAAPAKNPVGPTTKAPVIQQSQAPAKK